MIKCLLVSAENIFSVISLLNFAIECRPNEDPIRELIQIHCPYFFPTGNKIVVLVGGKLINLFATFMWYFLDVLIITVSIGLTTIFKLYNDDLKRANEEVLF